MKLPSARWFKSVLKEYEKGQSQFICFSSPRFHNRWNNNIGKFRDNLQKQAKLWARNNSYGIVEAGSDDVLFYVTDIYVSMQTRREFRINFLKWLIKKLEK